MNGEQALDSGIDQIEMRVRGLLNGRLRDFQLVQGNEGLVLRGRAQSYYAKQLAQQAVQEATDQRILCNEIEVP